MARPWSASGSASRRWPASPAWSAPPRSRTSAPTARRSRRPSRRCGSGTACSKVCAPSRTPTATSATAPRGSRPTPSGTSYSTSPSSSARAPSARPCSTPSWPAPSASTSASAPRSMTCARRCSSCAAARAWSSTPTTTTRGAPARSSPTRSSTRRDLPEGAPAWPQPDGRVKTSAAWLIEQAGFHKGYGAGPVGLSTKHTLALTNRGGATTEQLLALAREVRDGVEASARHPAGQRAGAGRLRAVDLRRSDQRGVGEPDPDDQRDEQRRSQRKPMIVITIPIHMPAWAEPRLP